MFWNKKKKELNTRGPKVRAIKHCVKIFVNKKNYEKDHDRTTNVVYKEILR